MKKLLFASFVAFWSAVAILVVLDALVPTRKGKTTRETIPEAVVKRHDSGRDCWLIIEGRVYEVTAYIADHPAPDFVLTSWCGMDATKGMRTKGYGRDHSDAAWAKLGEYQIGVLPGEGE